MKFSSEPIDTHPNVTLVTIADKISSASVMDLKKNLDELIKANKTNILLDLSELTFINSMGLGTIVNALKKVKKLNGDLKLIVIDEKIKFLFDILNLKNILKIYSSKEEALAEF
jgi:anti-sigma B factor antagonist